MLIVPVGINEKHLILAVTGRPQLLNDKYIPWTIVSFKNCSWCISNNVNRHLQVWEVKSAFKEHKHAVFQMVNMLEPPVVLKKQADGSELHKLMTPFLT